MLFLLQVESLEMNVGAHQNIFDEIFCIKENVI